MMTWSNFSFNFAPGYISSFVNKTRRSPCNAAHIYTAGVVGMAGVRIPALLLPAGWLSLQF